MFVLPALRGVCVMFPLESHRKQVFRWRGDANRKPLEAGDENVNLLEASRLSPLEAN